MSDMQGTGPTPVETPTGAATAERGREPATEPDPQEEPVMDLLAEHVPLALLVDLLTADGPASADILRTEGMPDDAWWEQEGDASPAAEATGADGDDDQQAGAQP